MGRMNSKNDVWAARDTFWNLERVKRGYKVREIAELLDLGEKITSAYFTGFLLPEDDVVKKFCDLFEIDFMRGKGEFYKAHKEYKDTHDRKCKLRFNSAVAGKEPIKPIEHKTETAKTNTVEDVVLEMLYGKIPYTDFKILTGQLMSGADVIESVYGKVDFETFVKILGINRKFNSKF